MIAHITVGTHATLTAEVMDDFYSPIRLTVAGVTADVDKIQARNLRDALTRAITASDDRDLADALRGSFPASGVDPFTEHTAHALDLIAGA